jgi:hypothetical protein
MGDMYSKIQVCNGQRPFPVAGPERKLWWEMYILIFGLCEVYIAKLTESPQILT